MKRNHRTGNTRKRVISFLLSALMVLSIVMPGGSGQVRYNAYAEGEEPGYESVNLTTEAEEETEEATEETTEDTTYEEITEQASTTEENTSEDSTEGENTASDTEEVTTEAEATEAVDTTEAEDITEAYASDNTVTTEAISDNDGGILIGMVNQTMSLNGTSGMITPVNDDLVGDGEVEANFADISFLTTTPEADPATSLPTGSQGTMIITLGRANHDNTSGDFAYIVDIDPTALDFTNNFVDQADGSKVWTFTSSQGSQSTITCKLVVEEGHSKVYISGIAAGQTVTVSLNFDLNDNTSVGEDIHISIRDNAGKTPEGNNNVTIPHTPGANETISISNTKTGTSSVVKKAGDDTLSEDISYTVQSKISLPKTWENSAGINSVIITDELRFGDKLSLNDGNTWNDLKEYLSVTGDGPLSVDSMSPIEENGKIVGINFSRTISDTATLNAIINNTDRTTDSSNIIYTTKESVFKIDKAAPLTVSGTGTMVNSYDVKATSKYNPSTEYTSIPAIKNTKYDDGSKNFTLKKSAEAVYGTGANNNTGINMKSVQKGNIVKFSISVKNNGLSQETINLIEEMDPKLSIATAEQLSAAGISDNPVVVNGNSISLSIDSQTTPEEDAADNSYSTVGFNRSKFSVTVPAESTVTGYVYAYVNYDITDGKSETLTNYLVEDGDESHFDSAAVLEKPNVPDPYVEKIVSDGDIWKSAGDVVLYSIKVYNKGYAEAKNVKVTDLFAPNDIFEVSNITISNNSTTYTSFPESGILVDVPAWTSNNEDEIPYTTITITGKIKDSASNYTSLKNTATLPDYNKSDDVEIYNPDWSVVGEGISLTKTVSNVTDSTKGNKAKPGETVKYTITVTNDSGKDIDLSQYSGDDIFKINDVMPNGITYVSDSSKYNFNDYGITSINDSDITFSGQSFSWAFTGHTHTVWDGTANVEKTDTIWQNGKKIIYTYEATLDDGVSGTLTNEAWVIDKTKEDFVDKADVIVPEDSNIDLEKYISALYDDNGNEVWSTTSPVGESTYDGKGNPTLKQVTTNDIEVGNIVEFVVKVKNPGDNNITSIDLDDNFSSVYGMSPILNSSYKLEVIVKDANGVRLGQINASTQGNNAEIKSSDFVSDNGNDFIIPSNSYITLTYRAKIISMQSGYIRNIVSDHNDSDEKATVDTQKYPILDGYKKIAIINKNVLANMGYNNVESDINYQDKASLSSSTDEYYVIYKIHVEEDTSAAFGKGFKVVDTLDSGLKFVTAGFENAPDISHPPVVVAYYDAWGRQICKGTENNYKYSVSTSGQTMTIESDDYVFDANHKYIDFYVIAEVDTGVSSDTTTLLNNNVKISFKDNGFDSDGNYVPANSELIDDDAVLEYAPGNINASHTKTAIGAFNTNTEKSRGNNNGIIELSGSSPESELSDNPTAGDSIIWRFRLTNENKPDSADMKDYIITDTLPYPYTFDDTYEDSSSSEAKFYPTITIHKNNSSEIIYGGVGNSKIFIKPTIEISDNTAILKWDTSNTDYDDDFILAPGEWLEVTFSSKIMDGKVGYPDDFVNHTTVKFTDGSTVNASSDGYKTDTDSVGNEAHMSIGGYATTSYKNIHYEHDDNVGSPDSDTGYGNDSHNYVKGLIGDKVTYTLVVKNAASIHINNMCIIDRLPYVNDIGVIDKNQRGSAFDVDWLGNAKITVYRATINGSDVTYDSGTDITSNTTISFAANNNSALVNDSNDWISNTDTVYSWHSSYQTGDKLIRFELPNDTEFSDSDYVEIIYDGIIPNDVTVSGESNIAWNDFAYAYHPITSSESSDVIKTAEPPKVGVWIEQLDVSAVFEAEKTVDGETPTSEQTFNFAVDEITPNTNGDYSSYTKLTDGFTTTGSNSGKKITFADKATYSAGATAGDVDHYYRIYETGTSEEYNIDSSYYIAKVTVTTATDGTITLSDSKAEIVAKYVKNDSEVYVAEYNNVDSDDTNNSTTKAVFDNKKKTGSVKLSKQVTFNGTPASDFSNEPFSINLTIDSNATASYPYVKDDATTGNITFTNGSTSSPVVLKDNEYITISGLPIGVKVTATEVDASNVFTNYTMAASSETTKDATIEAGETKEVTIKNTYTQDKGDLTITKAKEGVQDFPDVNQKFTISVTFDKAFTASEVNKVTTTETTAISEKSFTSGNAVTYTLKVGERIEIKGIPAGVEYTVDEDLTGVVDFSKTVTYGNNTHKITKDTTDTVTVYNKYTNGAIPASIEITKVSKDDSSEMIPNAVFGIYSNSECTSEVEKITTGDDGIATYSITDVRSILGTDESKIYYIKEISVPQPYVADTDTVHTVTISVESGSAVVKYDTDKDALTIENKKREGEIKVNKTFASGTTPVRVVFGAFKVVNGVVSNDKSAQIVFDSSDFTGGTASKKFTGLDLNSMYCVYELDKEDKPITDGTGVIGTTTYTVTANDNENISFTFDNYSKTASFTNAETKSSVKITKAVNFTSGSSKPTDKATKTFPIKITLSDNTINGEKDGISFTNGVGYTNISESASITITDLKLGTTVTVKEENNSGEKKDVIEAFSGYSYVAGSSTDSGTAKATKDSVEEINLINTYSQDKGSLVIKKSFEGVDADDLANMSSTDKANLKFTVTNSAGTYTKTITYARFDGDSEDGDNSAETYTITNLPVGSYKVTESGQDGILSNYILDTTGSVSEKSGNVTKDGSVIVEIKNKYEKITGKLKVSKIFKDTNGTVITTGLSDVTFGLFEGDTFKEEKTISGTDATRYVTFENLDVKKTYNVYEGTYDSVAGTFTKADTTVELNSKVYAVSSENATGVTFDTSGVTATTIDATDAIIYNTEANELGNLVIKKTITGIDSSDLSSIDKTKLVFTVKNSSNQTVTTVTYDKFSEDDDNNPDTYTIKNLPVGDYTVTESVTNDILNTYVIITTGTNQSTVTGTGAVTNGNSVTVELTNNYEKKTGSLKVNKIFKDTTDAEITDASKRKDVTIGLYSVSGATETFVDAKTLTASATDRYVEFTGLDVTKTYKVYEITGDYEPYTTYDTSITLDGKEYTITSEKTSNITFDYANTATATVSADDATITNTEVQEKGSLVIKKTFSGVDGADLTNMSSTDKTNLKFIVTNSAGTYNRTITYAQFVGDSEDGDSSPETYTITNLPIGSYTVTESGQDGILNKYNFVTTSSTTTVTKTVVKNDSVTAELKNTYTRKTGKLVIQKTFDSDPNLPEDYKRVEFNVLVTLSDETDTRLSGTVTYGGVEFKNGVATVKISVDSPKEISGIPAGYKYTVEEQTPLPTGYQIDNSGAIGTINGDSTHSVPLKNKYSPQSVSLKITKNFGNDSAIKSSDIKGTDKIVFTIKGPNDYSEDIDYYTFKDTGSITISNLTAGTYTVKETSYIPNSEYSRTTKVKVGTGGTEVTADSANVAIAAGGTGEVIFTNNYTIVEKAELDISKAVTGANAGDKEFKLEIKYTKDATTKYVAVNKNSATGYSLVDSAPAGDAVPTVKAGETLKIKGLPFGTYIVTEDTGNVALSGYVFNLSGSTVTGSATFDANVAKTVNLTNVYTENRSVKISKLDFATGTMISGAKLQLLKGDEIIEPVWTTDGSIKTITGLKSGVTYTLHEVSAPDGYAVIKDVDFVIGADNSVTVIPGSDGEAVYDAASGVIQLKDKKTSVKISKVDVTSQEELPGAKIQIIDEDGEVVEEWTSTDKPYEITGLKTGVTYTLRETVAPDGYQLTTDTTFTLNEDGSVNGTKTTTAKSNEGVLLVEDAPLGVLVINKQGFYNELCADDSNATKALEGVKFTLSKPDDSTFGQTKATDADGVVTFSGLAPGTYEVRETSTIGNYVLDEQVYTVKVNADGSNSGLVDASGKTVENNIIINDEYRADIRFVKVKLGNASQKLPGSTYGLYKLDEDNTLTKIAQATTDEDGVLEFEGVFTGIEYTVRELISPEGFYVSENPITISFAVNDDGKAVIDKIDDGNGTIVLSATGEITWLEPEISVSFIKQDLEGHNLAGAKLKVVDSDGNDIISWTSTTDAYLVDGVFKAGETYNLFEVEAPEGYEVAAPVSFTIDEKAGSEGIDTIVVVMKDAPITTTTVTPPEVTPPAPKTGDNTPVRPVAGMMMASLAGIMYLMLIGKRQRKRIRK